MKKEEKEYYEISQDTFKKMQNKMLEMLLYFDDFCKKHELMYYIQGGAAIGAIREHGFVPWDDDIDVLMPRPDYERFIKLWKQYGDEKRYVFCKTDRKVNYHHSCASLRDPNTTFICSYNQNLDICHGLAFEIGPIDGCPNSKIARAIQLFHAFNYALFNTQRLPNNKGKFFRALTKVILTVISSEKLRYVFWKHAEREMSKYSWNDCEYATELIGSIKGMLNVYPKKWFDSQVYVDFEGHKVPVMAGYDQYLRMVFGDYMKRPPESEQHAKHKLEFVDMDHPYTYYKNKKYFPGRKGKTGGAI